MRDCKIPTWKNSASSTLYRNPIAFLSKEPSPWSLDLYREIQYAQNKSLFVSLASRDSFFSSFRQSSRDLSLSFSPYFRIYPILAVDVFSLALSEHRYVEVRCFATVRDSWSSSRDEDHDSRDAEVEPAEKKRGARAGSFFCPFSTSSALSSLSLKSLWQLFILFSLFLFSFISEKFSLYIKQNKSLY